MRSLKICLLDALAVDMRRQVQLLLVFLFCLLSFLVESGEIEGLYEAKVAVTGQGIVERKAVVREGMRIVLTRVSGRRDIETLDKIDQALANALRYVQQFDYRTLAFDAVHVNETGEEYKQELRIRFDDQALNVLLQDAGLPVWGRGRPSLLIWLAVEDVGERYLLGGDARLPLRDMLELQAQQRGVPLLFPLLDLEDQTRLNFADVWGDFQDDIQSASQRYQAEGILVGRVYRHAENEWRARWSLYDGAQSHAERKNALQVQRWTTTAVDKEQLMKAAVDDSADILGHRFARAASELDADMLFVSVTDITTIEGYARTLKYFSSLDMVTETAVNSVDEIDVVYGLKIKGNEEHFRQSVAFGDTLAPLVNVPERMGLDSSGERLSVTPQKLHYRLLP